MRIAEPRTASKVLVGGFLVGIVANLEADARLAIDILRFVQLYLLPGVGIGFILTGKRIGILRFQLFGLCLVPTCILCVAVSEWWAGKQWEASFREALTIHLALRDYEDEQGRHPSDLHDLVPVYLEEVPRSHMRLFSNPPFETTRGDDGRLHLHSPETFHSGHPAWLSLP